MTQGIVQPWTSPRYWLKLRKIAVQRGSGPTPLMRPGGTRASRLDVTAMSVPPDRASACTIRSVVPPSRCARARALATWSSSPRCWAGSRQRESLTAARSCHGSSAPVVRATRPGERGVDSTTTYAANARSCESEPLNLFVSTCARLIAVDVPGVGVLPERPLRLHGPRGGRGSAHGVLQRSTARSARERSTARPTSSTPEVLAGVDDGP